MRQICSHGALPIEFHQVDRTLFDPEIKREQL